MKTKQFIVAAVSTNRNSFGLHQVVLLARDGDTQTLCSSDPPAKGTVREWPMAEDTVTSTPGLSFEIPEKKEKAPEAIVKEVWGAAY